MREDGVPGCLLSVLPLLPLQPLTMSAGEVAVGEASCLLVPVPLVEATDVPSLLPVPCSRCDRVLVPARTGTPSRVAAAESCAHAPRCCGVTGEGAPAACVARDDGGSLFAFDAVARRPCLAVLFARELVRT